MPDASTSLLAAAAFAIPDLAAFDLLRILQRHPGRLPSNGLRNCRQVDVELRKSLSSLTSSAPIPYLI
jgi:hypothetical protein